MKTFGKIAALAISLIFIIGIMVLPVNAAGNPEITVSDASGNIGDEVTVIISFTSNPGIAGFNADITYDKNNLELTDMSGNSGFGGSFMGNVIKSKFVWYNASNITSTGTFTTLKFKIKDTAKPNTYEIGLSYSQGDMSNADGDDVTATIHAGKITVTCNHTYGSWEKNTAENHKHTCKVCGNVETAAHTWDSGKVTEAPTHTKEGTKTYTCTVCGETKTEKVEKLKDHSYGEWTKHDDKQHKHSCVCGDTQYAAHTWDSGKVTKAATCKDTGEKLYTCTACGETKTEAIAKTNNHTYGLWEKNTAENHKHTCKVCGNVETAAHTWDSGKVTVKPTSTTKGQTVYTCTLCGETKTVETDYSHSHSYGIKWHYDNNMHWHECTGCGSKQTPRAHTFGEAKIITPATHTSTGKAEYKCTVCGATVEKEIAKITEHNFGEWSAFDGEKHVRSCECGEKEYASHTAGEWETVKEATYTSAGEKVRKCMACGTVVSREEIPAKVKDTTKPVGTTTTNKTETTTTTTTSSTSAKQTETTKSTESKGCKSFVGVGASFTCVLAIGTALVLGKKKDD